jgi:hypothetical protein
MENRKIILIDTGSESNRFMMSDIAKMEDAIQISDVYQFDNKMQRLLFKVHFGFKLNRYMDFPFKFLWDVKNVLENLITDDSVHYYVILTNDVIRKFSKTYIEKLKLKNNVDLYIVLLDAYNSLQPYFRRCIDRFNSEKIYSFQKSDCDKHGFKYTNTIYSRIPLDSNGAEIKSDIYFIGAEKGRIDTIYKCFRLLKEKGLRCNFFVIVSSVLLREYRKKYPGICFLDKRVEYTQILKDISETRCILELCQVGQDGLTMRFYEAVFYNKCLITNNITAKRHALYNEKFMQIFENVEELKDFQLYDGQVTYHYNDEMSPIHLVEEIINKSN